MGGQELLIGPALPDVEVVDLKSCPMESSPDQKGAADEIDPQQADDDPAARFVPYLQAA